ncbi:MAG: transposase [Elusimicrobiota bacterium]|nr:transposase [Elusimicrobiota bacterium]
MPYSVSTKYVGLDEFSYLKWHTYGVILEDLVTHKTIDMVAGGKTKACAKAVLSRVVAERVEGACIDMWEAFKIACLEMLPNALIVVDKFHVVKLINEALENVRKRITPDFPEEQSTFLFENRFILLTGKERLTDI